jgi:SPP1 family predicted phage head-tail adaptor
MRAGKRRHYIAIEQISQARDARGELTETWSTFASAWAAIEPVRGREYFLAHAENGAADTRISLPYVAGVTRSMRVNHDGRLYDIQHVLNIDERNRELNLMCLERT